METLVSNSSGAERFRTFLVTGFGLLATLLALFLAALDLNVSTVILNGAPPHRHAQPGTASPHHLFGVKRLEYPVDVLTRNADAAVGHFQHHVIPLFDVVIASDGGVDILVVGFDADPTCIHGCFGGIGNQVHHRFDQVDRRTGNIQQIVSQFLLSGHAVPGLAA